jgi:hypothetical protein
MEQNLREASRQAACEDIPLICEILSSFPCSQDIATELYPKPEGLHSTCLK